ncbi:hypothetical protein [Caldibacillus thermoamylovorans]|uniref:hypothetical protein n=1 Tax=Caldibacillus thermoamylovorans TaxID=35841 RepID=UPI0022DF5851|nr:hypothetical protein [Caldibacillus thermoamylovorans]
MSLSNSLKDYIFDGDLSTKLENVEYSTNLREIVTVGYMIEHLKAVDEEAVREAKQDPCCNTSL